MDCANALYVFSASSSRPSNALIMDRTPKTTAVSLR